MSFTIEDALGYYKAINALVTKYTDEKGKIDYNQFWSAVLSLTVDNVSERTKEMDVKLKECGVGYMNNVTEYLGWNVSLMVMSWLLYNLKKKTEDGHCHIHDLPCKAGSEPHNKVYLECLNSFKSIIESFEKILQN